MTSFCVIRKYNDSDKYFVQSIIAEAVMQQVGSFFTSALFSDTLLKIVVMFIGFGFIILGVPLKYCLIFSPIAIILLYVFIFLGHWAKANELSQHINNIMNNYMKDPCTSFYVAEVYGKAGEAELASLMNKPKKVEYDFYNEKELNECSLNIKGLSRRVVGCVGITKSMLKADRAWIRKMAVKKEYRRRHIGTSLLTEALKFCKSHSYSGADLITTEYHAEARQLFMQEGFEVLEFFNKSYLGIASRESFHLHHALQSKDKEM